jgi:hypothetical protein
MTTRNQVIEQIQSRIKEMIQTSTTNMVPVVAQVNMNTDEMDD